MASRRRNLSICSGRPVRSSQSSSLAGGSNYRHRHTRGRHRRHDRDLCHAQRGPAQAAALSRVRRPVQHPHHADRRAGDDGHVVEWRGLSPERSESIDHARRRHADNRPDAAARGRDTTAHQDPWGYGRVLRVVRSADDARGLHPSEFRATCAAASAFAPAFAAGFGEAACSASASSRRDLLSRLAGSVPRRSAIVGKPIRFAEVATTIAGVAPRDFDTPHDGDFWFSQRSTKTMSTISSTAHAVEAA